MSASRRVASRYQKALKKSESETVFDLIDKKFKDWEDCFKPTGNIVQYTTVKGWSYLSEKERADPLNKARYDFALKLFEGFNEAVQKDISKQVVENLSKPNLGLPEDVFSDNKLNLTLQETSEESLKALASEVSRSFKTDGFQRGALKQFWDASIGDEFLRRTPKMLGDILSLKVLKSKKKDENPEVRQMVRNCSLNWTMTTVLPLLGWGAGAQGGVASVNAVAGLATTNILTALGATGVVATVGSTAVAFGAGMVFYKKALHQLSSKRRESASNFDSLASDIYSGYQTPEGVEAEYSKKLQSVLEDKSLSPKDAREKICGLYSDFQENARPSIDKGLKQLGYEGHSEAYTPMKKFQSFFNSLKLGSEDKLPTFVMLARMKHFYDVQDMILEELEKDPVGIGNEMRSYLSGEKEIDQELVDALSLSKKSSKTSSASRVLDKSLMKPYKKTIPHSERELEMDQRHLKRQVVRQVMQRRASQNSYEGQIRTAAMYYQAGAKDSLKAMLLKYVVNPIDKFRRHLDLFTMPVDDLMDDVIEAIAPEVAEKMLEAEVDADFEEFEQGAKLRNQERAMSRGGYVDELDPPSDKSPEFIEGYVWGDTNQLPVPPSVKKKLVEEAAQEHSKKVIERALKKAWHTINPIEIIKHAFEIIKKYGWDADADKQWYIKWPMRVFKVVLMAIAVAFVEVLEHYLLPYVLVKLTGIEALWATASIPLLEIITPIIIAYFKGAKDDVVDEPGHLDWYEENYGEIEEVLDDNVFGKNASYAY
jgi:hypothetical protein